jgi:prevent-host-death family protein
MDERFKKGRVMSSGVIVIGTDEVRKRMGEILDCVNLRGDEFMIERKNKPLAVLIPVRKHELMMKFARERLIKEMLNNSSDLTDEEADAIADEIKHLARKE